MINLRNSPFLWISLMLLLSFWSMDMTRLQISNGILIFLFCLCGICCLLAILKYAPHHQYKSSIILGILIFFAGIQRMHDFKNNLYAGSLIKESCYVQGIVQVRQVLKNRESSVSLKCRRIQFFNDEKETNVFRDKYILVYIKTGSAGHFLPGDIIRSEGWLTSIQGPRNPNAFDARKYYNTIGIRHQMYCKEEDLIREGNTGFSISRMTAKWQRVLSGLVHAHISAQAAQLTNALVWGDRSDMDNEIIDAFANSGAMHVLSVSGMHVAIIYSMLYFLLGAPGRGTLSHRLSRFACYSFSIILYVGLTGACPAVIRAGLMIIMYLFGKSMGWHTQVLNLLGFAAFVMLWINPYVWQNISFQLSFLAMAGILLFAKPVIRIVSFKNKILNNIWQIIALSIVAQIFILPILLRQFHQFPLTFIISSIVAVPAAYLVIFGALLNIILSFTGIDALWPALDWTGGLFINTMKWMSGLNPGMHFSLPSVGSLFLMTMAVIFSIAVIFHWNTGKKIAWIFGVLSFITLGCHRIEQWQRDDMVIFHSTKGLVMDLYIDGHSYSIFGCHLPEETIDFVTRGYRCERDIIGIRNICTTQDYHNRLIKFDQFTLSVDKYKLFIWNGYAQPDHAPTHIIIDQCTDVIALKEFLAGQNQIKTIIPAHLNRKLRKSIENFLEEQQMDFYDIEEAGYFKLTL